MAKLFNPFFQAVDGNGNPLAGAKLNFYITGTTTRKNTYSDPDLDISHVNANPVVADSNGRFPVIYLAVDVDYKVILTNSADVTVSNGTVDPLLFRTSDSVIANEGDLIVGDSTGAEVALPINANADAALRSTGTTAEWRRSNYTVQKFLSGSGTWTKPANCTAIKVRMIGGGGGGGGAGGTTGPTGATGGTSSFNSITVIGGSGGVGSISGAVPSAGGVGGTGGAGTATFRIAGGNGEGGQFDTDAGTAASGGQGVFGGGAGGPGGAVLINGIAAAANSGGGGSGPITRVYQSPGGGGAGEYAELHISLPSASYTYAVGAGGAGGIGTGVSPATGGAGGSGIVIVEEFYS